MMMQPRKISAAFVVAFAATAIAAQKTAFPYQQVSIEYGGVITLPCENPWNMKHCSLKMPPAWAMTAWVDGNEHNATGYGVNGTHCSCNLCSADAEAPMDVYFHYSDGGEEKTHQKKLAGRIQYYALFKPAFSKRPYLSIDVQGDLAISVHDVIEERGWEAKVAMFTMPALDLLGGDDVMRKKFHKRVHSDSRALVEYIESLDGSQRLLEWTSVKGGVASLISFEFPEHFPEDVQLMPVLVLFQLPSGTTTKTLFLSRVSSPNPNYKGSVVQVDYARKTIRANNRNFIGVGYYDSQTESGKNLTRLAKAGLTWGMRYLQDNAPASKLPRKSDPWIKDFFDWHAENHMMVLFDIFQYVESLMVVDPGHKIGNTTEKWANITKEIVKFREHPALLGYYICDDCTTQFLMKHEEHPDVTPSLEKIYTEIKKLDPYHPIIGAEECANAYTFTGQTNRLSRPTLDVVMVENYVNNLSDNAHGGNADSPGMDGSFDHWPLTWEPIVNCPGAWRIAGNKDSSLKLRERMMYSISWLSAVQANLPMQLHFRLFPFPSNEVYEGIMEAAGRYANIAGKIQGFLDALPSGVAEPWLVKVGEQDAGRVSRDSVGHDNFLGEVGKSPAIAYLGKQHHDLMSFVDAGPGHSVGCEQCARIWRAPGSPNPKTEEFCAAIAVVNTQNNTATVFFKIQGAERWPDAGVAVFHRMDVHDTGARVVDEILKVDPQGRLRFDLQSFESQVFATECGRARYEFERADTNLDNEEVLYA